MNHLKHGPEEKPAHEAASKAYASLLSIIVAGDKEVAKFVTPSGVTGVVATNVSTDLLTRLRKRLEGKLRRTGYLTEVHAAGSIGRNASQS